MAQTLPAAASLSTSVEVAAVPVAASETPAETPAGAALAASGNITIDFKEADIQNVLRLLALKSGVNIVAGNEVKGLITVRLADVPWEKALDVVLKTYGYTYEKDGNIIRVTSLANMAQEALQTEVFVLTYASAKEAAKTLKEMLSERGSIRDDARTNTLIVTDIPSNIYRIKKVLERLDQGTPQVLIETKIIEMSLSEAQKLGVKWNASLELRGPSRPTTFPFDYTRGEESLLRYFPRGKPAGSIIPIDQDGNTTGNVVVEEPEDFPTLLRANHNTAAPTFPFATPADFTFGKIDTSQFKILFEAIKSSGKNKVLSEPKIMVLSNQEARILVGEELYIPNYERNDETGTMEITGYIPRRIGIELVVNPQVNHKREVSLVLKPSISSLTGFEELTPDVRVPRIAIRDASTVVRIQDRESVALGGLIKEDTIDNKVKFPILGDLPLLEKVFSHSDKTVIKTDLMFFITVTVLDDKRRVEEVSSAVTTQPEPPVPASAASAGV